MADAFTADTDIPGVDDNLNFGLLAARIYEEAVALTLFVQALPTTYERRMILLGIAERHMADAEHLHNLVNRSGQAIRLAA